MEVTERNQMGYDLLLHFITQGEVKLDPTAIRRRLGNIAKATGYSVEKLNELGKTIYADLAERTFSGKSEKV